MIKYKMVASMETASQEMMSPVVVRPTAYFYHLVMINPCVNRNAEWLICVIGVSILSSDLRIRLPFEASMRTHLRRIH